MREILPISILEDLPRKTDFLKDWSWFKFNNLLVLEMTLEFYSSVAKSLKTNLKEF